MIPRQYISKATVQRYGTDKIFRVELVGYWRLLYTVIGDEIKIIAFILEYMNHHKNPKGFLGCKEIPKEFLAQENQKFSLCRKQKTVFQHDKYNKIFGYKKRS